MPARPSPELELFVAREKHKEESALLTFAAAVFGAVMYVTVRAIMKKITVDSWNTAHSVSASLYFPALAWAVAMLKKGLDRSRPTGTGAAGPADSPS